MALCLTRDDGRRARDEGDVALDRHFAVADGGESLAHRCGRGEALPGLLRERNDELAANSTFDLG